MRQALLCHDRQEALEMLANPNPQRSWSGSFSDGRPVVLLLSGEGDWGDLVPALCEQEPEFRREIESCCEQARSQLNLDLRPGWLNGDAPQDEPEAVSRARGFVAGYALARLWLAWGIVPQGLFGLGTGEPLAACLAGVLPFADAVALALGATPEGLGREALESPRWSLLSPVTGGWLSAEEVTDPAYWSAPERDGGLDQALGELCNNADSVLLEVGPAALLDRIEEHADFTYEQTTVALDQRAGPPPAALLTLLGRVWTAGVDVDWRAVYEHQRRRRVELPTYPFERERFWIDPPRDEAATAPRRDATTRRPLAEWFYAPTWQGRYLSGPISGLGEGECWLVLSDGSSLAAQIGQQLAEADENVVTVRTGDALRQTELGAYVLRPDSEDDYHGLIAALSAEDRRPARVIHLGSPDSESGFWSLIYLARALGGAVELGIVTEGLREVSGEEQLRWENASILAPITVLPHEFPELRPWSADVLLPAAGSRAEARLAADLLREFGREERITEVVYRRGHRYVRSFEPLELSAEDTMLRDDGVYLITDGSAGFGLAFGEFLAQAVRAQLVLASSVELPAKDEWMAWLEEHGESDDISLRIRRILALEEHGARVLPIAADITDVERMKAVVGECVERFGRLDGVIHAPAEGGSQAALLPVTEIDDESFAGRIHQRVRGA
ncbi:MAG: KR domain-containing protein, partial [bacterium]|nr:KR domain-containing protein [bacterium]